MDDTLRAALELLIKKRDEDILFDCEAEEGGYPSQELENALNVIEAALARV